ncbi:alpha/beta hydrolase [Streptomyces sp. NPDC015346]|uniref:alpha/beta hydrolase n=1 Tax=Streptomyces sp. NPDC015346 TaxID=3364954 RepID=UPI00370130E7
MRETTLDAAGVTLSALVAEPAGPPRATVVAIHGGGMTAGYFDSQSHPDTSLLTLGARLGFTVVAVDRPGYGLSRGTLPDGQTLSEQSRSLRAALGDLTTRHPTGAGVFLLAHSYGGKLALTCAADLADLADPADPVCPGSAGTGAVPALLGVDVSGIGHQYAVDHLDLPDPHQHRHWKRNWGALRFYPPNTFKDSTALVEPMPTREWAEAARWPRRFTEIAARIRVPVRLTFAEHELWWRHDPAALADLEDRFHRAPFVTVDRQPDAGHNISLGRLARTYHLRALAFLEECLARGSATT